MKSLKINFKDWSIFSKILSMAIVVIIPFAVIIGAYILPEIEEKLYEDKKEFLRNVVNVAETSIKSFTEQYKNGELTLDEAKQKITEVVSSQEQQNGEKFFIETYNYTSIYHPVHKVMLKTPEELKEIKDKKGKYFLKDMINIARTKGDGFVVYYWPKQGHTEPSAKMSYVKSIDGLNWLIGGGIFIDDVDEEVGAITSKILLYSFFALIGAILIGLFISKLITKPIKILTEAASNVSLGKTDIQIEVTSKDELGYLSGSFNKMLANIKESKNLLELEKATIESKVQEAVKASEAEKEYLNQSVNEILTEMNKLANGDLTVELEVKNDNAIGQLFKGFNNSVKNIREMMIQISEAIQATASATSEISSSTEQMAAGSQEQSTQASEVASAIEEMAATIIQSTQNANNASNNASSAVEIAHEGGNVVKSTVDGMNRISEVVSQAAHMVKELGKNSDQIGEIVQVIDDIADQTNLLALNAAIEAARAGEQGRGFAVVADEVRKLAERTTKATREIADMINKIQNDTGNAVQSIESGTEEVEKGKELAAKSGSSLKQIIQGANETVEAVKQVADASNQQSQAIEKISISVEGINSVSHESAMGIQEVAKSAEDLNQLTKNLNNLVEKFKVKKQDFGLEYKKSSVRNYAQMEM